jgi:hypothetical protein
MNDDVLEAPLRHVHKPLPHDSGAKHVQGSAEYIDDIGEPIGTLHIAVGGTPVAPRAAPPQSERGAHRARLGCRRDSGRHTFGLGFDLGMFIAWITKRPDTPRVVSRGRRRVVPFFRTGGDGHGRIGVGEL